MTTKTLAKLGFSMPAEWEPHEATWLGWPQNAADWPGSGIRGTVEGVRELDLGVAYESPCATALPQGKQCGRGKKRPMGRLGNRF